MFVIAGDMYAGNKPIGEFQFMHQLLAFKKLKNSVYRHWRHGFAQHISAVVG